MHNFNVGQYRCGKERCEVVNGESGKACRSAGINHFMYNQLILFAQFIERQV